MDDVYIWLKNLRGYLALASSSPTVFAKSVQLFVHKQGEILTSFLANFRNKAAGSESLESALIPAESVPLTNDVEKNRYILTDIGGKKYRIESDDDYLDHIGDVFEPHMVRLFKSLIKPTAVVLDVGANIGCTSILFGSIAQQITGFEPSPTTFKFLERNVAASGLKNIALKNVGLGKNSGTFELTFAADNRSGGFVSNKTQASAGHQIETIQILQGDDFMAASGIDNVDFIKIDVEGFERDVIEGLSGTISKNRPIVILELNHWCLNVLQRIALPDFLDFLKGVFPLLCAVGAQDVCDLHDPREAYHVMYRHVVGSDYQNIVGAFEPVQMEAFAKDFKRRGQ